MRLSVAIVIIALAATMLRRWSTAPCWHVPQRLAVALGLLLISPLVALVQAYLYGYGSDGDRIGLVAVEILVAVFLVRLAKRVRRSAANREDTNAASGGLGRR